MYKNLINKLKSKNDLSRDEAREFIDSVLQGEIPSNVLIYYCANKMIGHNNQNKKLIKWEIELFKNSDSVFVISELLKKLKVRIM